MTTRAGVYFVEKDTGKIAGPFENEIPDSRPFPGEGEPDKSRETAKENDMKASRFIKGDFRKHGELTSRGLTMNHLGKKQGFPEPASGQNRHERRREKAMIRRATKTNLKGRPTLSIVRRMVRAQGLRETIMLMHGRRK